MTGQPARSSSNRSSGIRKRALRRLAREQHVDYALIYEQVYPRAGRRDRARGQAWTQLGHKHLGRYLELYAEESVAAGTEIPPGIRSKAWQRTTGCLADLHQREYRRLFEQFRAGGMPEPRAYDRAMAGIREANSEMFAQMLAEEYRLWLAVEAGDPTVAALAGRRTS
jgi:hypothetical protein